MKRKICKYCKFTFTFDKNDIQLRNSGRFVGMFVHMIGNTSVGYAGPEYCKTLKCPYCGRINDAVSETQRFMQFVCIGLVTVCFLVGTIYLVIAHKYEHYMYRCDYCGSRYISDVYEYIDGDGKYHQTENCKECNMNRNVQFSTK